MELLQLRYFAELASREHLNRTAQELIVSPSAISTSISRLEKELGVKLFDRVGRNIRLNAYGKSYLKHINCILNELDCAEKELADMLNSNNNKLVVATVNPYVWQTPVQSFHRACPNILLRHITYEPISSNSPVPPNDVDIVIASPESFSHPDWDSALLFKDRIVLAVPHGHPFTERESISLCEARDEWFVSLGDSSFQRKCVDLCREAGFEPRSRIECDYMLRPRIVLSENMVALTTYNGKQTGVFSGIPLIPLTDPGAVREQAIFWRRASYIPQSVKFFKEYMVDLYREYKPSALKIEESES